MANFLCASVLFYFSFPNIFLVDGAPCLAWGCVIPLLFILEGRGFRARFLIGLIWGVAVYGMLVSWLFPISPGGWALFVVALSLQGVLFTVLFPSADTPVVVKLFLIPCAWVVSEWARAVMLGGFSWSLGYAQGGIPELIQPAAIGGVYAVAWVIVFVNTAVYLAACSQGRQRRNLVWTGVAVFIVLLLAGTAHMTFSARAMARVRVAVIQPNIQRDEKTREDLYDVNAVRHLVLMKRAVVAGKLGEPDLVAWPETAFTDDILTDMKWRPRLEMAARNFRTNILVGSALLQEGKDFNSALLLSPQGVWRDVYHKVHLVPFCEFTPRGAEPMARSLKIGKYQFTVGIRPGIMALADGKKFGVAICSEELYPGLFRQLAYAHPGFMVVMLNDGWFSRREALFLHALAAPLRAVETGVPVVRAANTGRTIAFDALGRKIGRSPDTGRPDIAVYDVPLSTGLTGYVQWGDVFAVICFVFVIITYLVIYFQRSRARGRNAV